MKTTIDVARQTSKFYLQANLLLTNLRIFRHCSDQVKCVLFNNNNNNNIYLKSSIQINSIDYKTILLYSQ